MRVRQLILPSLAVSIFGACRFDAKNDGAKYEVSTRVPSELSPTTEFDAAAEPTGSSGSTGPATSKTASVAVASSKTAASAAPVLASGPQEGAADLTAAQLRVQQREFLATHLIKAGDEQAKQGNLEAALKHYADALDVDPVNIQAKAGFARTQAAMGDLQHFSRQRAQCPIAKLRRKTRLRRLGTQEGVILDGPALDQIPGGI